VYASASYDVEFPEGGQSGYSFPRAICFIQSLARSFRPLESGHSSASQNCSQIFGR
jgi:hypothetical protein